MRPLLLSLALLFVCHASAQRFDPLRPPNTYRNADNPHYWKNRPPHPGYWQQDVHYLIKARLDDRRDAVQGELTLYYHNNSPDTLRHVFFHLYQEAYEPGSYADQLANGRRGRAQRDSLEAGTTLHQLLVNGTTVRTEQDNTVLKAWLNEPLPPGERATFRITFTTQWSAQVDRRMKLFQSWGWKHYDGVHWYPRIAVYDRRFG